MTTLYALCSILLLPVITYGEVIQTDLPFSVPLCSEGPSIWCRNITNAIECKAVKHCIQTVWKVSRNLDESDDGCSNCVDAISKIKNGVNANQTKEIIEEALDYVCELTILTSILRKQCERAINKYVDTHINDLLDLINSDISPTAICKIIGLCGAYVKSTAPPKEVSAPPSEEVEIKYNNIVLHFPANDFDLINILKPSLPDIIPSKPKAKPLFGSNKCTWGPDYFCNNLNSSRECSTTKTCIERYWNKKYPEDDDSVCQVCKDMVKQARDQLLSNETQEELKEVFEGSCKLIPIKDVRNECINLVDEFIPELTDMLASQMNPTAVCTIAGLCNSKRIDELIKSSSSISETSSYDFSGYDACSNCSAAYSRYRNYFQNNDKFDLTFRLNGLCAELSTYSEACVLLVNENIESIFNYLNNEVNYFTLCHYSGMCSQGYHTHQDNNAQQITYRGGEVDPMVVARNDDLPCDLCKQLVTHLKQILVANTTESEFRQMLLGICAQTGKFKSKCVALVEDDFKIIYQFVTDELSPEDLCEAIQICPKPPTLLTDVRVNTLLTSSVMLNQDAEMVEVVTTTSSPATTTEDINVVNDVECRLCIFFISEGEKLLQQPTYANDVKKMLGDLCKVVPASEKDNCNKFVNTYAETLINLMVTETDPKVVCRLMAVCPTLRLPSGGRDLCPICSVVLHFIQNELDSPKERQRIINTMRKACNVVPSQTRDECKEFVNEYTEFIVSILSQEVDPSLVCPALKLCRPNFTPTGERCETCRVLTTNMIDSLNNNYTDENIRSTVSRKLMIPVGGNNKNTAVLVASELQIIHREAMIDMLTAEFDATESCVYLEFCDAKYIESHPLIGGGDDNDQDQISEIAVPLSHVHGKPSCAICELLVKEYEKKLSSNATEKEIEDFMNRYCDKIKVKKYKNECHNFVDVYLPKLLELIREDVSPKEFCTVLQLCSSALQTTMSSDQCTECEVIVGAIEGALGDPRISAWTTNEVMAFCDGLPEKYADVCFKFVEVVMPQVEGILFEIPPWFMCSKMKSCVYGENELKSYDNICANPERWCENYKIAFACDKMQLCNKTAWRKNEKSDIVKGPIV